MTRRFCGQCGAPRASDHSRFCIRCGHPLVEQRAAPTGAWGRWIIAFGLIILGIIGFSARSSLDRFQTGTTPPTKVRAARPTPQAAPTKIRAAQPTPQAAPTSGTTTNLLVVHLVDVGQGDGILIQAPDGTTVVIDGGYPDSGMLDYLQRHSINHIDALIASHPHADHIGGQIAILETMAVDGVWSSGASHTTSTYEDWLDAIINAQVPYHEVATNDQIMVGSLVFEVLRSEPQAGDLNDTSVVVKLAYGTWSMLFTGDAEGPSEHALLETAASELPATVLKVGHHGSGTSSGGDFVAAVDPAIAIYSAGQNNSYGHPHPSVITTLCNAGAHVYGTDVSGTILVMTDGTETTVEAERALISACD